MSLSRSFFQKFELRLCRASPEPQLKFLSKKSCQDQGSTQIAREWGAFGAREALSRTVPVLARFWGGKKIGLSWLNPNF